MLKSDIEAITSIYRHVNDAMVAKNTAKLSELIKSDTVLVHITGYVQPIKDWLAQIESEEMTYYSWGEKSIEDIQISGDRASLVGRSNVRARIWGAGPSTWSLQIKMEFERVDGKWLISHQTASTF